MSEEKKRVKKPKSKTRVIIEWVLTGIFLALFCFIGAAQIDGMVHRKEHYNQQIRFGYATFVVQTSSMEPEYKVKTAIITYLEDADKIYQRFQKGETVDVTFINNYSPNTDDERALCTPENTQYTRLVTDVAIITHRVQEIHVNPNGKKGENKYFFIAAGINTEGFASGIDQYQAFTEKQLLGRVVVNSPFLGGVFNFISSPFGLLALLLIPAFYLVITSVLDIFKAYKDPDEATETSNKDSSGDAPKGEVVLSEEDKKRLKEELLKEMINKKKGGQ